MSHPRAKSDSTLMSVLVSVRNTDPKNPIRVVAAPYYNTDGVLIRNSVPTPRVIPPFGTFELFVELRENAGGSGANYAIKWEAATPVSPPTIEALHSKFQAGYSVAFISRGRCHFGTLSMPPLRHAGHAAVGPALITLCPIRSADQADHDA
jgi:hypothetical protein